LVHFVKAVDYDYTLSHNFTGTEHEVDEIDWASYFARNIPNVLRMCDYYRSFTLLNKYTYFVKNFALYIEVHEYLKNPYS